MTGARVPEQASTSAGLDGVPDGAATPGVTPAPVAVRIRIAIAAIAGAVAVLLVLFHEHSYPLAFDIDQSFAGMRALGAHQDPYAVIGPTGPAFLWPWKLFYPVPGLLVSAPVAWLPATLGRSIVLGGSSAWLAYRLSETDPWRLVTLMSGPFISAMLIGCWEPTMLAAAMTPGAAIFYLVKPNEGLAFAIGESHIRRPVVWVGFAAAAALLIASIIVWPEWIGHWRAALKTGEHFTAPIFHPGGVLVLAALVKWRRPEARMLATLACVPQTMWPYASLPLFLVPRTRTEFLGLAALSYISLAVLHIYKQAPWADEAQHIGTAITLSLYLPCLIMVLRRPNASPV